jgi:hypothetical protein
MTDLVVGDDLLLLRIDDPVLLLQPADDPVHRLVEIDGRDLLAPLADGEQGRLVDGVGQIGAGKAGGLLGDHPDIDFVFELDLPDMDLQDLFAAVDVGPVDQYLAVEAAGSQQGRIEDLGPVGRRHDDDPLLGIETVHLHQQLVQGLFPLVVAAVAARPPRLAEGVELVDEDDAGGLIPRLIEQIPDPGGAHADEELDKLGPAHRKERHPGLAGDGPGDQGLARPRWADQQHALGHLAADLQIALRPGEIIDDLLQFLLGLIGPGDIAKTGVDIFFADDLGLVLAEIHDARLAALQLPHQQVPDAEEQQDRHKPRQQGLEEGIFHLAGKFDVMLSQLLGQVGVDPDGGEDDLAVAGLVLHLAADPVLADGDLDHLVLRQRLDEFTVGNDLGAELVEDQALEQKHPPDCRQYIPDIELGVVFHVFPSPEVRPEAKMSTVFHPAAVAGNRNPHSNDISLNSEQQGILAKNRVTRVAADRSGGHYGDRETECLPPLSSRHPPCRLDLYPCHLDLYPCHLDR